MFIKPTVGRIVDYWPQGRPMGAPDGRQPFAAQIAYVWSDHLINISFLYHDGTSGNMTSVALIQGDKYDDRVPADQRCCTWMDYQKDQAKRHEEAKLKERVSVGASASGFDAKNAAYAEKHASITADRDRAEGCYARSMGVPPQVGANPVKPTLTSAMVTAAAKALYELEPQECEVSRLPTGFLVCRTITWEDLVLRGEIGDYTDAAFIALHAAFAAI